MARLSSIDALPEEIQAEIGRLRQNGRTIDEILGHLRALDGIRPPSRSALGRHIREIDEVGQHIRQTRQAALALKRDMEDGASSAATAEINIEMLHTAMFKLQMAALNGEAIDAASILPLARALDHLGRASKSNVDVLITAERRAAERARTEAATAVETIAKERGISGATIEAIKAGIFGVRAAPIGHNGGPPLDAGSPT